MYHPPSRRLFVAGTVITGMLVTFLPATGAAAADLAAPGTPGIQDVVLGDVVAPSMQVAGTGGSVLTEEIETEPFTVAGLTWDAADLGTDVTVELRLRERAVWSEWQLLDVETGIPDPETEEGRAASLVVGTEPLLTDGADAAQARLTSAGPLDPAAITLSLLDGSEQQVEAAPAGEDMFTTAMSASGPSVVTRAQWGADESLRNGTASVNDTVKAVFVHHTASTNSYTSSDAAAQIRSIYAYHTQKLGWADIGYNFLVDKFGTVYEGRAGSITKAVQGAHTGGFNSDTMGVSALGNYETTAAPSTMVQRIGEVTGWKLGQYGNAVDTSVSLTSAGGGTSRYSTGTRVTVRAVSGHRDVGYTACPGVYLYNKLSTIRSVAVQAAAVTMPLQIGGSGATPLTADVDGDGRSDVGWFRDGAWAFKTAKGTVLEFSFGRRGDVPIVGDFARSGRDAIGIVRDGAWHVRWTASAGPAQASFAYGQAGDVPVVGTWPGTERDSVGVKRGNRWHLRDGLSGGVATQSFSFGLASDSPTTGDWNGKGYDLPGLLRAGRWHLAASTAYPRTAWSFAYGTSTDRPVGGDWDGNGADGPGVVRGTTFLGRNRLSGGGAEYTTSFTG